MILYSKDWEFLAAIKVSMRAEFAQAAKSYDECAVLAQRTQDVLEERLDYVRLAVGRLADIGCATGNGVRALQKRYPKAEALAIDFAFPMLQHVTKNSSRLQSALRYIRQRVRSPQRINANLQNLPLPNNSLTLVWSNLVLQWQDDLKAALTELYRITAPGGLFCFATFGPNTLLSLRRAGASTIRNFLDMHDVADLLVQCGFQEVVVDAELVHLQYKSPRGFLRDQRLLGVRNALCGKMSVRQWRSVFSDSVVEKGKWLAEFEVIYGHAWKPQLAQQALGVDTSELLAGQKIIRIQPKKLGLTYCHSDHPRKITSNRIITYRFPLTSRNNFLLA